MNAITENILREAADAFAFDRTTGEISRYGEGHINDTFVVWASDKCKRYIMQRINTDTFKNPKELMENVCHVTGFLRKAIQEKGGDPERETLNVIPTKEGKPFYTDSDGSTWRAYIFVEDTVCLQKVENENDFYTVAETFGTFQNQLAAFPAATLHETIVKFHDTPTRYQNFEKAVAEDAMGRAKDVADEIAFVRSREADCHVLVDMLSKNEIPLRVTHNDTKLNNVLIDKTSKKGVCVIDLDTVMPGLAAYDFGDSIRFGANDCAEDEPDQNKVHFDLHLFEVFAKGFLSTAGATMSEQEKSSLVWGAKLMTLECGMRFLTDYLEGDHYFRITLQKKGASSGDCDLVAAEILSLQKNYDQALALYIKVFNEVEDPQLLSHAYLSAANAALNQDDMEKAVRILKQGCQNLPEGQAVLQKEMLADLMMQQAASDKENAEEYYAEAQQLLEELVDSGYDTIATRLNLATVLQALDQYSEAEKVLKDLQEQYPSDYRFDMQMAYLLIDQLRTSGWLK